MLKDSLTKQTNIFTPSSHIISGALRVYESNGTVYINSVGSFQINDSILGTIDSEYRPNYNVALWAVNISDKKAGRLSVNASNGNVTFVNLDESAISTTRLVGVAGSYGI